MSSTLESKPFFVARARAVGLNDTDIASLESAGVSTLAGMAFFCAYQPGTSDDSVLVAATAKAIGQDPVPAATMVSIRRLHYESHAMYVADLRSKVVSTEDEAPKRMPNAERAQRYNEQKARLGGLILEGDLECSNSLLDAVMQQYDRDELKYIQLHHCTSREQEMSGSRRDQKLALDSEGMIKVKPAGIDAKCDVSTDMKVKSAMTRRGLAYDQASLISFEVHAKWTERLFSALSRSVPDGYAKISLHQIVEADKELWQRIADECRSTIVPKPGQDRPLDEAIKKWMFQPEVMYYLMPMPASKISVPKVPEGDEYDRPYKKSKKGGGKGNQSKGGKGSKGKGKGSNSTQMPAGCVNKTKEGRNICFAFNSPAGCTYAKPGSTCKRGVHLCAKPGCAGRHSAIGCGGSTGST